MKLIKTQPFIPTYALPMAHDKVETEILQFSLRTEDQLTYHLYVIDSGPTIKTNLIRVASFTNSNQSTTPFESAVSKYLNHPKNRYQGQMFDIEISGKVLDLITNGQATFWYAD